MGILELDKALLAEIEALASEGRAKAPERVIVEYIPPSDEKGPGTAWPDLTGNISA